MGYNFSSISVIKLLITNFCLIIFLVCRSNEPMWLYGTLNGKSGLIPENYCEFLN